MKEKQPTEKKNGAGKPASKPSGQAPKASAKAGRLGPGQLDKLVLAYMRGHKGQALHTASVIGKKIGRSSGAVANCLVRLEKAKEVRLAQKKPRAYKLKGVR